MSNDVVFLRDERNSCLAWRQPHLNNVETRNLQILDASHQRSYAPDESELSVHVLIKLNPTSGPKSAPSMKSVKVCMW